MTEHVDVLIVGAGISGIGAGYHLQSKCPDRTYAILERRENVGGTWDLFRYPGIRSDSDMYTLGFRFRPWTEGKAIADGPSILRYLKDTARTHGIDRKIRFGSGATAVTLVPALAEKAEHVTMLQRSPSYFIGMPRVDKIAEALRRRLPGSLAYGLTRWKNILVAVGFFQVSRRFPERIKKLLMDGVRQRLGPDFDVDTHFNPRYAPWDQRLCFVPDDDFFAAVKRGKASMVTDHIETFTERGIMLRSGAELEADLVVTATGLNVVFMAGMNVTVDGQPIDVGKTMAYRALMFSDIPNLAVCFGYTNAPWTLKADLTAEFVCRVLQHMRRGGYRRCVPVVDDPAITAVPFAGLSSGYIQRALDRLPKQGHKAPWRLRENYPLDLFSMRYGKIDDGVLRFS